MQVWAKIRDIEKKLVQEKEMELLPNFIHAGDEAIDIGANFAYYSVPMSQLVKEGKIFSFEPIPFTYEVCRQVLKHFHADNVELFQKGVGNKNEQVIFQIPLQEFGGISAGQAHIGGRKNDMKGKEEIYSFTKHQSIPCEVVRIDDFLLPRLRKLTFVKMDIEGAEYFALQGMVKTLEKFKPVILSEVEPFFLKGFSIDEKELRNFIYKMGYQIFFYDEKFLHAVFLNEALSSANYIFIHQDMIDKYSHLIQENS